MTINESPPRITAVVGESGSGKTTLARLLLGLETPTQGEVLYRGRNVATMDGSASAVFARCPICLSRPLWRLQPLLQGRSRPDQADCQVQTGQLTAKST
ncbi:MAG: ATP-binding cassette domain-containing protein [Caldilineaceae bacterium]